MKKYFVIIYWLLSCLLIFSFLSCSSQKLKIQEAQSQNFEFLLQQAKQLWEVLPEGVSVTATRWPSFSASGFAVGGTLTLQLDEDWTRQVRVSPVGRIYQP